MKITSLQNLKDQKYTVCIINWKQKNAEQQSKTYHISIWVEYSEDPRRTSGGLYHNVTTSLE